MTADDQQDAAREFQPVEDPAEALRLLKEGAKTVAAAMIWTAKQDQVLHSHLSLLSEIDKHVMVRRPTDFDVLAFEQGLAQKGTPEVFFSVSLVSANIFFRSKYVGADADELAFAVPETIYKVQRRSDVRFPIPDGHVLHVTYLDPADAAKTVTRKVLDISAGGICFLIASEETEAFPQNMPLSQLSFTLHQRQFTVDGVVRHVGPLADQKRKSSPQRRDAWRVGVQFVGMRPADNHAVAAYVLEESRKFFSRFA